MNTKQLTEKVAELEKRVEELERRPVMVQCCAPKEPIQETRTTWFNSMPNGWGRFYTYEV